MKILHISTYDTGGAGIAATRIHEALLRHGLDSKFLCLYKQRNNLEKVFQWDQYKTENILKRVLQRAGIYKSKSQKTIEAVKNLGGKYEIFTFPYTSYDLLDHPMVQEADILHLHWVSGFLDYQSFFSAVNKPVVWTTHDLNPVLGGFHYENDVQTNKQLELIEKGLKEYKHALIRKHQVKYVGVSDWTNSKIREYLGNDVSSRTIRVALNFDDLKPVAKPIAKQALGLETSKIIIGIGAQYFDNHRKGYWLFMEAYNQLEPYEKAEVQVISFGSAVSENESFNGIISFGKIENNQLQSLLYSAMDLFVLPSLEETLGLTGVEAMSCDTPVLGSRVGGITDYLQDGENGVYFTTGDVNDLLVKLKILINNKEILKNLSENSRASIVDIFDEVKIAGEYTELYEMLL